MNTATLLAELENRDEHPTAPGPEGPRLLENQDEHPTAPGPEGQNFKLITYRTSITRYLRYMLDLQWYILWRTFLHNHVIVNIIIIEFIGNITDELRYWNQQPKTIELWSSVDFLGQQRYFVIKINNLASTCGMKKPHLFCSRNDRLGVKEAWTQTDSWISHCV